MDGRVGGRAGWRAAGGRTHGSTHGWEHRDGQSGGRGGRVGGRTLRRGRACRRPALGAWQIPSTNPLCMQMDEAHAHTGTFARAHANTLALPSACSCGGVHIEETKAVTLAMICVVPCVQIGCTVLGSVVQNCHQHRMPQRYRDAARQPSRLYT